MSIRSILVITLITINIRVKLASSLPEVSTCDANGYPGTCVPWKQCETLLLDHKNEEFPPLCSSEGLEPFICCTSCTYKRDITKAVADPTGGYLWKTNQKSWNQCVDYFVDLPYECKSRVEGRALNEWIPSHKCFFMSQVKWETSEKNEDQSEFPYTAMIGYGVRSDIQWRCRGTVISDRFILTAAHCAYSPQLGLITYAALGVQKRSKPEDPGQVYDIDLVIPHPEYRKPNHDIALLETGTRIRFNKDVLPACLPNLSEPIYDEDAETIEWHDDTLRARKLRKFDGKKCSKLHRRHSKDDNTQLCYGGDSNVNDTCVGDGGGPLLLNVQIMKCQKTIIGVMTDGCYSGSKAVYTRVQSYVEWIESIVWP